MRSKSSSVVTAACLVISISISAQSSLAQERQYPLEPADTSSPQATLTSFLESCNAIYKITKTEGRNQARLKNQQLVDQIIQCLDLSDQPQYLHREIGGQATVCLKEVFDRIELPPLGEIPGEEDADLLRYTIPHTQITIARVIDGPRSGQYLFSPETVARSEDFYERVRHLPYIRNETPGFYEWYLNEPGSIWLSKVVHNLPAAFRRRFYGQAVWQWLALTCTTVLGALVMLGTYRLGRWRAAEFRRSSVWRYCVTLLFPIAAMLVPLFVQRFISHQLVISGMTLIVVKFLGNVVFLGALIVVLIGLGNRIAEVLIASPRIQPAGIDAQFIRILSRVLSLVAATIVFLEGGQYLGIPLTTLLAGAGVGGLAMALAAQDMLKNFFGSVMILLDKPYRVGERIQVKGYDGVVEEIGLRSTKLRLLTGHQVSIPNEEMARLDIENIGRRPHIRRVQNLALPLDTSPQQVERALQILRELLTDHTGQDAAFPPRVYHDVFNRDSLNIIVYYWFHPANFWQYLAFSESFNLLVRRRFDAAGICFALPASTNQVTLEDRRLEADAGSNGRSAGRESVDSEAQPPRVE